MDENDLVLSKLQLEAAILFLIQDRQIERLLRPPGCMLRCEDISARSYQSWFEKRRTGYPVLPRGTGIPSANQFPTRSPYPTYLQSLNKSALDAAITSMGGDNSTTKVWWEK